jgi:hypothetical protein
MKIEVIKRKSYYVAQIKCAVCERPIRAFEENDSQGMAAWFRDKDNAIVGEIYVAHKLGCLPMLEAEQKKKGLCMATENLNDCLNQLIHNSCVLSFDEGLNVVDAKGSF